MTTEMAIAAGHVRSGAESAEWLAFTPRDTVIVRDGRSFDAGADDSAESVRPWPSTVAGAVRTAYGGDRGAEPGTVRGPVLARRFETGWEPYFPMPADIAAEDGETPGWACLLRPDPELRDVVTDLEGVVGLLSAPNGAAVQPLPGWLPGASMSAYLRGEFPAGGFDPEELGGRLDDPLVPERRVGLARTRGRTAMDGFLYQATHLRPRDGWGFLAQCVRPAGWARRARGPVQLGGRGRLADVSVASGVAWPECPEAYPGGRVLVYVATPALWPGGWLPPVPGARLAGAAVPAPQPVAVASPYIAARDGRSLLETVTLRWAVPAGAVYLLSFDDERSAAGWAHEHHGRALGPALGATDEEDRVRTAGFGVVLTGIWEDV
jgi:CRISPR type III-B/RAMP module-associated protein Cmr3